MDRIGGPFLFLSAGVNLKRNLPFASVVLAWGFCLYLAYSLGLSGTFYYDDIRPLSGLPAVTDFPSSMIYALGEISGPLGRPLSMLEFPAQPA
ncbi:MAG: hypothetical protein QM805_02815 [Pseudomonas sp.]